MKSKKRTRELSYLSVILRISRVSPKNCWILLNPSQLLRIFRTHILVMFLHSSSLVGMQRVFGPTFISGDVIVKVSVLGVGQISQISKILKHPDN